MSFSLARLVGLAGASVALVAFFLPWVTYTQRTFSAFDLATSLPPALAAVKAGGIKGFDVGLWAVALAAVLAIVFLLASAARPADPREGRFRLWATSAAKGVQRSGATGCPTRSGTISADRRPTAAASWVGLAPRGPKSGS